jgi:RNA polymerase sigma factor (sigma-70 family)
MASRPHGAVLQHIQRLFERGSLSGLSEWQLLDRYASRRDESAFEALVARHGPMVLGVCRRVLDDPDAVEDAFQATFLVLVRKARTLGERDAIGHWLYGVACRVALRARCEAARRRSREVPVGGTEVAVPATEPGRDELAPILDTELSRLPAKYRAPIVLCYLEGLTHEEAARQLHWPIGSVKGRLARARDLLRMRLARHGLVPAAGLLAVTTISRATAAVPESLRQATVQAGLHCAGGRAAAEVASASVVRLMEGVLSTMFLTKLKVTAAVVGTCGVLALGAWGLEQSTQGSKSPPKEKEATAIAAGPQSLRDKLDRPLAKPLKLQDVRLDELLKTIKAATQAPGDTGVPIYVEPEGLKEAGATIDSPVTFDGTKLPLKTALDVALRPLRLGATIQDGLLVITSRQEVTLIELRALNEALQQRAITPGTAASAGMSPSEWLKRMHGRGIVFSANNTEDVDPEDEARTRAVLDALKKPVPMPFKNETPLEDVLTHIREQTKSQELPDGIPIYVDPVGLNEAEKTMTSPITFDLKGVALRESLPRMLKQLGLVYMVKDGLLSITSESSENAPSPILMLAWKAEMGELSLNEMNELIEFFKVRKEISRYAAAEEVVDPTIGGGFVPAGPALAQSDGGEDPKTRLILNALERVVPLHFEGIDLDTALAEIKKATAGPGLPDGIPIYRNPTARRVGIPWQVTLNLNGVKLKTSLRLLLGQVELGYSVSDCLLIIDRQGSPEVTPMGAGGKGAPRNLQ